MRPIETRGVVRPEADGRGGFGLIEVLVALILLTISLAALAPMSYQTARRSLGSTTDTQVMGVSTDELSYLVTQPFDSLPSRVGCTTSSSADLRHTVCVDVTDINEKLREVTVIITPQAVFARPDTIVFRRADVTIENPFEA